MLNASVQAASTAVSTTGRYSGLQPAITALIATFSTVQGTRSGGAIATTSSGRARGVPSSIASTRASVGGTIGSPSVQPRSKIGLLLVLEEGAISDAPGAELRAAEANGQLRRAWTSGSTLRASRSPVGTRAARARARRRRPGPPTRPGASRARARPLGRPRHADQRRHGLDAVVPRDLERSVSSTGLSTPFGKGGVVLGVDGELGRGSASRASTGHDELAGRAVALHEGDEAGGERRTGGVGHGPSIPESRPLPAASFRSPRASRSRERSPP